MEISKAIFLTNTFAEMHPDKHTELWNKFIESNVDIKKNSPYGVDNLKYIEFMKKLQDPVFMNFARENITVY